MVQKEVENLAMSIQTVTDRTNKLSRGDVCPLIIIIDRVGESTATVD